MTMWPKLGCRDKGGASHSSVQHPARYCRICGTDTFDQLMDAFDHVLWLDVEQKCGIVENLNIIM